MCVHVHVHVCVISQIPLTPALILRHVKYILYINLTYKIRDLCQKKSRTSACIIKRILTRTFNVSYHMSKKYILIFTKVSKKLAV